MRSKLGRNRRLWYLVIYGTLGILKYSWPKPLREEPWLLRPWRRRWKEVIHQQFAATCGRAANPSCPRSQGEQVLEAMTG